MRSTWFFRAARAGVALAFAATVVGVAAAAAVPAPERPRTRRAFNLFAVTNAVLDVNRVFCGINNLGEICVDPTNSPVLGGGFWPKGSPDQYIFNSGLQIAGRVDPAAAFAWAGDVTGAFFFDARGTQVQGDAVTLVYNSLNLTDAASWPNGAVVRDTGLYNPVLLGRTAVSQQDLWTRAWDGNPSLISGRTHPMGILVEERGLAWNFPSGNEDILYFIFRFYNITASDPAAYNNATIEPEIRAEIAAVGAQFQARNEAAFGVTIPDGGYALQDIYAAFSMDPDVGDAGVNYSTGILPFSMGVAYKADFLEPDWFFPPDIFGAPFVPLPGFVGVKYLKSPINPTTGQQVGLSMFSNTLNAATGFPDPTGVAQLYRYLSGTVDPSQGDNPCTVSNPQARKLCFLAQNFADTRFYQSSGPFRLGPGEAATIVVAYVHAAPLPVVTPFVAGDMKPGIPPNGAQLFAGDTVRTIERAAGWVSHAEGNTDSVITQDEVVTVPRSLLDKALVAQAVFDNKFLLPFAPEVPQFFVIPGDNQVTIAWSKSATEDLAGEGDPFADVATDPISPLYDPNFRRHDVEGYRIYRGRTTGQLELVAQFDYAGTVLTDYTGAFAYSSDLDADGLSECAPEIGITDDCPADFAGGETVDHQLVGDVVQVPAGGRVLLADSSVLILKTDSAVAGGASGHPKLTDAGVPFVYIDRAVRNSFRYFYAVTAFDVNSLKSGPSSLESPRITKIVTPRRPATNVGTAAGAVTFQVVDRDGNPLAGAAPTLNPSTGTFSGPAAPSAAFGLLNVDIFAPTLIEAGGRGFIKVDSIVPEWYHLATYYLTGLGPVVTGAKQGPNGPLGEEDGPTVYTASVTLPADTTAGKAEGLGPVPFAGQATASATLSAVTFTSKDTDWHPDVDGSFFGATGITDVGGSRWFDGANETMADPALGLAHGQLTDILAIYRPVRVRNASNLFRRFDQLTYHLFRAADIKVYWGATAGTVDSVIDVTHNVTVPFAPQNRASWGFLRDFTGSDDGARSTPDGVLTYNDFVLGPCLPGSGTGVDQAGCDDDDYQPTALLTNVDVTGDQVSDGTGFGLYINGEPFIFRANTLPANTVWTYRSYHGVVGGASGSYTFTPKPSNPAVPGLQLAVVLGTPAIIPGNATADLSNVHTVPDPYYVTNALEITANTKVLKFVNVPKQAIIRIYSVSGILVQVVTHNDPANGGEATWNLRNRNNQFVASGVYFYHVETPSGQTKVGRFTVVNFAQ